MRHALDRLHDRSRERDNRPNPPIDESTYGGSTAETGGLYDDEGATITNPAGKTMFEEEERAGRRSDLPCSVPRPDLRLRAHLAKAQAKLELRRHELEES